MKKEVEIEELTKSEISELINELIPKHYDDRDIDFSKLSKDDMILLKRELDYLYDMILEGSMELFDDIISNKAKEFSKKRLDFDEEESNLLAEKTKKRLEDGPIITKFKEFMGKRLLNKED